MKIGLIGVGRWGRTLAAAFGRAGIEVAIHSRLSDGALPNEFGLRVDSWKDMIGRKEIDAIVAATPPDVTTEIFTACQQAQQPCLLTKPLLLPPEWNVTSEISTTTYVDYLHLFSPLWRLVSRMVQESTPLTMSATSTGPLGPGRSFPQSLDYGPHALALLLDAGWIGTRTEVTDSLLARQPDDGETLWAAMTMNGVRATMCAGQGLRATTFHVKLADEEREVLYAESGGRAIITIDGEKILQDNEHDPLAHLVQQFIWDIEIRDVNPKLVQMSAEISIIIENARKSALSKLPPQI